MSRTSWQLKAAVTAYAVCWAIAIRGLIALADAIDLIADRPAAIVVLVVLSLTVSWFTAREIRRVVRPGGLA